MALLLGVSLAGAALAPGNQSFQAKWADWLRAHHAGLVVAQRYDGVAGAASFVIYRDGRVDIGAWGSEISMTPEVASVLQNVVLLVDKGQLTFNFYSHAPGRPAQVTGTKLYPEMQRPADRYLPPVWEARDFFEVLLPGAGNQP